MFLAPIPLFPFPFHLPLVWWTSMKSESSNPYRIWIWVPASLKLNVKNLRKGCDDIRAHLLHTNPREKLSQTTNGFISNATGYNPLKAEQLGANIQGKAVHCNPARHFDPYRCNLA